ncbi:MAG: prepilin-type N-terminal cleavage/methylation domain-containing protein [Frankiaceae bacterium]|nr:prepilin-type N-terminal cleavage/methylation domain-containing protein [Frankiaceae bacterium]MBV9368252.1 prepilin-type N-terminal cleavage/methylation domain-containing protein [Frankiales bacterium]
MLQRLQTVREREDGFTLIELLIVIVILGVLAAIVVFGVSGINDSSKLSACKSDYKSVEIASEAYYANASPHAYAASIAALVSAGFLKETPSTTNGYTITYSAGTVGVTGGPTGCP